MKPHVIELLISDCDGVLVDSEILSERIVMDELSRHAPRTELEKLLEGTFGLTTRDIIQRVEERFGITLPEGIYKDIRTRAEQLIATQASLYLVSKRLSNALTCRWPLPQTANATA